MIVLYREVPGDTQPYFSLLSELMVGKHSDSQRFSVSSAQNVGILCFCIPHMFKFLRVTNISSAFL